MAETQAGPEDIVVIPDSSRIPSKRPSSSSTPSGTVECLSDFYDQRTVRAKQESQQISGSTASRSGRSAGVAFSEGGIRSAAFCSGALSRMLLENVLPDYLSCVSGGGYTGTAFVEWKERQKRNGHNSIIIVMIANDMTNSLTPCDKTLATCATGNVPFQVFGIQQCS